MTGKVLNGFRIKTGIDEIRDIGMAELMGGHLKIKAVHRFAIVRGFFSHIGCKFCPLSSEW